MTTRRWSAGVSFVESLTLTLLYDLAKLQHTQAGSVESMNGRLCPQVAKVEKQDRYELL